MKRSEQLRAAIISGDKDTVEWIVDSGGAPISSEHVDLAQQYNQLDIVKLLQSSLSEGH